jgi:hypothetical protein
MSMKMLPCCCGTCYYEAIRCDCADSEAPELLYVRCADLTPYGTTGSIAFRDANSGECYEVNLAQEPIVDGKPLGPFAVPDVFFDDCEDCCDPDTCWHIATLCDCDEFEGAPEEVGISCASLPSDLGGQHVVAVDGVVMGSIRPCYELNLDLPPVGTEPAVVGTVFNWYAGRDCTGCCSESCPLLPPDAPSTVSITVTHTPFTGPLSQCYIPLLPVMNLIAEIKTAGGSADPRQTGPGLSNSTCGAFARYCRPLGIWFDVPFPNEEDCCTARWTANGPACGGVTGGMRTWSWTVLVFAPSAQGTPPNCTPNCTDSPDPGPPPTCTISEVAAASYSNIFNLVLPASAPPPITGTFTASNGDTLVVT